MKRLWDAEELGQYWSLSYKELELQSGKSAENRLGFFVQLKCYLNNGRFPLNQKI